MCTGTAKAPDNNNYYNGQVRNYAGGWGYTMTDYQDTTKTDLKEYFDDKGKKLKYGKKNINSSKKLSDYKKEGAPNEPSKTTSSGVNVDTINR
jgi:hypothetical protein